jgi:hypothetical protein
VANEPIPVAGPAALVASGLFPDLRSVAQAQVKVAAGRALGLDPVTAVAQLNVIKGRVTMSAQLMAALIKRSGKYDYAVVRLDATGCELAFAQGGREIGRCSFVEEDARRAGLLRGDNYRKYPEDMFFARCLSRGARRFCPDALLGAYVGGEIDPGPERSPPAIADAQPLATPEQLIRLRALKGDLNISREAWAAALAKRSVASARDLTQEQAEELIVKLAHRANCKLLADGLAAPTTTAVEIPEGGGADAVDKSGDPMD